MTRVLPFCPRLILVVVLLLFTPLVLSQNHPLKFFRMYLKNTLTNEVQACFPRNWAMTDIKRVSDVFDSAKDRSNFVFGFDGPEDIELHDCSGSSGSNIDLTPWGCDLEIIRNADPAGQSVWEMKLDMAVCNHAMQTGLEPDARILVRFFDEREFGKTELSADHYNLQFDRVTSAGYFRQLIRFETNYSAKFGPPNFDANKMELNINFRRNLALDFEIQANIPVYSYNQCTDSQRCLEAIYSGMDVPPWICPIDPCPPGYQVYKDDLCYLSLVTDRIETNNAQSYRIQTPAFLNVSVVERITGTRNCLERNIDPTFCYSRTRELIKTCMDYTNQDYAYSL